MQYSTFSRGRKFILHLLWIMLPLSTIALASTTPAQRLFATNPSATNFVVYADALATDWEDWSWDQPTIDLANANPVHSGTQSIAVTFGDAVICAAA